MTSTAAFAPHLAHCGVFQRDLDLMTAFCCEVFDLQQTDRGKGRTFDFTIAFLGGRADPTFEPAADRSARFEAARAARLRCGPAARHAGRAPGVTATPGTGPRASTSRCASAAVDACPGMAPMSPARAGSAAPAVRQDLDRAEPMAMRPDLLDSR